MPIEWIRRLWYVYIMDYYLAIKKNTFVLVLMRWMKLEPIIHSEVSQKEKYQYSISSVHRSVVSDSLLPHELQHAKPPYPIPLGHPSARSLSALSHASNPDWSSISYVVIYMFQCYSLKSSHPRLLPQTKVCSLHLCLFCCLAYRVVVTIFVNSMCMR